MIRRLLRKHISYTVLRYTTMLLIAFLPFPLEALAAEMVANGNYNTSANWTLAGTVTGAVYDAGNTNTADGSGSIYVLTTAGKNQTETGIITQTGLSIVAGSEITNASDVVAFTKHAVLSGNTKPHSIIIEVNDGGWIQVYSAVPTDNQVWTSLTNGTATAFPYTVVNGITDVRVTIVAKTGN
ncbi:MAG: hypothetical protein OEV42_18405, partial [Deltaproteobacteria bacterium]|nr:hypothetical protein [Deltaproteobacteria bacterium]